MSSLKQHSQEAKVLLSELAATVHTYEYSPSVQEVETLSALQLGTSTFGFLSLLGCGFGTMAVAYRIPRLRPMFGLRAGIGLMTGLYASEKAKQISYIVTLDQLLILDSPMGSELEALVTESDMHADMKQRYLIARTRAAALLGAGARPERIRPDDSNSFTAAMRQSAEAEFDRGYPEADTAGSSAGGAADSGGESWSEGFAAETSSKSGPKQQRPAGHQETPQASGEPAGMQWEDDFFDWQSEVPAAEADEDSLRPLTHKDRREERRLRRLEQHRRRVAPPNDGLDDYFDRRWEDNQK